MPLKRSTRICLLAITVTGWIALSGCGPIEATMVIYDAQVALAGARAARAHDHAPYEYVTAELFLEKAREERGYAHFGTAIRYARKSAESAREAQTKSMHKVREEPRGPEDTAQGKSNRRSSTSNTSPSRRE